MNEQQIMARLNEVFRDVFDDDTLEITRDTTAADIEDWDSLEHINLIAAVEAEFHMRFNMKQVTAMKNVGEMADVVAASGR